MASILCSTGDESSHLLNYLRVLNMAELIAAGTAIGVASSFITFSDIAWRVLKRLKEYSDRIEDVPAVIKHIKAQLPILIDKMAELKQENEGGSLIIPPRSALDLAVRKCEEQIKDLDDLTMKMCLETGGVKFNLLRKTLFSIRHEKKVSKAWAELEGYKTTFIWHFTNIKAPDGKVKSLQSTEPIFMVPFEKDLKFVGRHDIMTEIDQRFRTQSRVALRGIGGVGKTQIAIEYCYRFRERRPDAHVFWVHASNAVRFDQAYKDIARKLALPGCDDHKVNTLHLVAEWLSDKEHGSWLMVLDNADDIESFFGASSYVSVHESERPVSLFSYIPKSSKGSIIVTTRDARVGQRLAEREKPIVVLPLAVHEAECLLRSKLPQDHEWGEADTAELLDTLGCLPLAITQAAAFINENIITLVEYIETLQAGDLDVTDLLSEDLHDPRRDGDALSSVVRTWKLSFDQIQNQKPRAAQLLSLMAVLDRHGVPKSLLSRRDEQRTEFTTAIGTLQAFSLITAERGGEIFVMHRLVQLSVQNWLELQNTKDIYQEEAVELLSEKFPSGEHGNWKICEALSPHAQVVLEHRYTSKSSLLHRATLLYNVALYESHQGRYETAYSRCMEAHDTRQSLLGENDFKTLSSLGLLAWVLNSQGRYKAAEEMNRRALDGREKVLGKEHPDTLASMSHLAVTLGNQGKYRTAEEMHRRVLELRENVLGKEHPETLASIDSLATSLRDQGKYEAAEEMYRRALELRENVLGKEHPDTLTSMNNLAATLGGQGKYEAAEGMHRRGLELCRRVLAKDHPDTLASMNNLAETLRHRGRYEAAGEMHRRVLELKENVLGKEHPDTLASMNNLAETLRHRGRYEAAGEMHRRVLELKENVLGKEHPDTLASMNNLASALGNQGKYEAAEEMHRRELELCRRVLGKEHPKTLTSMGNLAWTLRNQGKYEAAEEMHRRELELCRRVLGKEHPDTLTSMGNLAWTLRDQGKCKAAEEMHQQVLELRENVLGKEHPDTLASMNNLATTLGDQGKYEAAEEMYRRVLELRENVLGKEHPDTLASMNNLAATLGDQGKYEAAKKMHRPVLELRENVLGKEHPDTLTSMNNLALTLGNQGKYEAAEEMHRRVLELRENVLGKEHPNTLTSMNNLALTLGNQGKYEVAEEMLRRELELCGRVLGKEHPNTLASMGNLAWTLESQGKCEEAEEIKRWKRDIQQKKDQIAGDEVSS